MQAGTLLEGLASPLCGQGLSPPLGLLPSASHLPGVLGRPPIPPTSAWRWPLRPPCGPVLTPESVLPCEPAGHHAHRPWRGAEGGCVMENVRTPDGQPVAGPPTATTGATCGQMEVGDRLLLAEPKGSRGGARCDEGHTRER